MSTRLVAAITMIPSLTPKPSISTSNWFSVCSRSSCPPPIPVPRRLATASISSIKMIQGAFFLASSNRSLTRDAPTPTNISTKSEPEIVKNGTPASPATAFASSVLPVPGGPTSNTPFGILAPTWIYFFGDFRKSTISSSSSFSSSRPATWQMSLSCHGLYSVLHGSFQNSLLSNSHRRPAGSSDRRAGKLRPV